MGRREEIERELDSLQDAEDRFPSPRNRVKMDQLRKELEDAASEHPAYDPFR